MYVVRKVPHDDVASVEAPSTSPGSLMNPVPPPPPLLLLKDVIDGVGVESVDVAISSFITVHVFVSPPSIVPEQSVEKVAL